jgi:hypothetical protein
VGVWRWVCGRVCGCVGVWVCACVWGGGRGGGGKCLCWHKVFAVARLEGVRGGGRRKMSQPSPVMHSMISAMTGGVKMHGTPTLYVYDTV